MAIFITMTATPLTKSIAYTSLIDTPQTSTNYNNPLRSDVNGDGVVSTLDLTATAKAWNSFPGHPRWNSTLDLNNDGIINILDMVLILRDFGMKWMRYDFDSLSDWTVISGSWNVVDDLLEGFSNAEGVVYCRDRIWKDFTLDAKVKITADSPTADATFVIRFVNSGNFYWAGLGCWGHKVSIARTVNNVPEELIFSGDHSDVVKDVWYDVSIKIFGTSIELFVNDVLELAINDSTFTSGAVGIRSWNSHILVDCVTVSGFKSSVTTENPAKPVKKLLIAYGTRSPLRQDFIAQMAKFDMVDTDFGIGPDVKNIKMLNPKAVILGYKAIMSMGSDMDDWTEVDQHEDWFLHDLNGNRLQISWPSGWYCMDISNRGWWQHYADYVKEKIGLYGFDGVMVDNVWTDLFRDAWTVSSELVPDWNYQVNAYTYWQTQMRQFLSYVKNQIGSSLLICNCPRDIYLDVSDGRVIEDFVFAQPSLNDIGYLAAVSVTGKYCLVAPYEDPSISDTPEKFLYAFCCFLLGQNGPNAYFSWINVYAHSQGYYPEMDFDFGKSMGGYYLIEGALYGRDFVHAKVLVNLSETETYTLEIGGIAHTLNPKSGLIVSS